MSTVNYLGEEMSLRKHEALSSWKMLIGFEWVAAADLHRRHSSNGSPTTGTISRQLNELHRLGVLDRQWDGNERYGRWVYRLSAKGWPK